MASYYGKLQWTQSGDRLTIPGLRNELLQACATANYQSLGLGLIAHRKNGARYLLSGVTIDVMLHKLANETEFPDSARQGMFRLHHRFLTTFGDAVELFDELWSLTSHRTVRKCSAKSQCSLHFIRMYNDPEVHKWQCASKLNLELYCYFQGYTEDDPLLRLSRLLQFYREMYYWIRKANIPQSHFGASSKPLPATKSWYHIG